MFATVSDQPTILAKITILNQSLKFQNFKQSSRKKKTFFPCLLDFRSPVLQTNLHITNLGFRLYPTKQYRRSSATSKQQV